MVEWMVEILMLSLVSRKFFDMRNIALYSVGSLVWFYFLNDFLVRTLGPTLFLKEL